MENETKDAILARLIIGMVAAFIGAICVSVITIPFLLYAIWQTL